MTFAKQSDHHEYADKLIGSDFFFTQIAKKEKPEDELKHNEDLKQLILVALQEGQDGSQMIKVDKFF